MTDGSPDINSTSWLLCRAGARLCALPLENVVETMRLLPIEPVSGAPRSVLGLCPIRGLPVPVVDLQSLLAEPESPLRRMVTLKLGSGTIALAVESVLGVRSIGADESSRLPPLLREAAGDIVTAIGMLDSEFLLFLNSARMAPLSLLGEVGPDEAAS
ncbi:MAG: chemotaxis protein CheW [Roseiarcus sp.]|jgi:purine-binding chemotaxis protein CheW